PERVGIGRWRILPVDQPVIPDRLLPHEERVLVPAVSLYAQTAQLDLARLVEESRLQEVLDARDTCVTPPEMQVFPFIREEAGGALVHPDRSHLVPRQPEQAQTEVLADGGPVGPVYEDRDALSPAEQPPHEERVVEGELERPLHDAA